MTLSGVLFHRKSRRIFLLFPFLWFLLVIFMMVSWKLEVFTNIDTRQSHKDLIYQHFQRSDDANREDVDDIGNFEFEYNHEIDDSDEIDNDPNVGTTKYRNKIGSGREVSIPPALGERGRAQSGVTSPKADVLDVSDVTSQKADVLDVTDVTSQKADVLDVSDVINHNHRANGVTNSSDSASNVIKVYRLKEGDFNEDSADSVVYEDEAEASLGATDSQKLREAHDKEMVRDEQLNLQLHGESETESSEGNNQGNTDGNTERNTQGNHENTAGEIDEANDGALNLSDNQSVRSGEISQTSDPDDHSETEPGDGDEPGHGDGEGDGDGDGDELGDGDREGGGDGDGEGAGDGDHDTDINMDITNDDTENLGNETEDHNLHKDNVQENIHRSPEHIESLVIDNKQEMENHRKELVVSDIHVQRGHPINVSIGEQAKNNSQFNIIHWHQRDKNVTVPWPDIPLTDKHGEKGKPVKISKTELTEHQRERYEKGFRQHSFNQYVSDMISVTRSIPDLRDRECLRLTYPRRLPSTSVIIVFRNEAWTVLLRTLHTVLARSPAHLLHQVILVDDDSDKNDFYFLKEPLEAYVKQFQNVLIVRTPKREGLIRARLLGVQAASGEVITFLDSHCEVNKGWLEPMLSRIGDGPSHVVMPIIDVIDQTTFAYRSGGSGSNPQIGGFSWKLMFEWDVVSERERARRTSNADPVRSPTMAGGLFAINREYFYQIGSYDKGMDVWGAENLEMSFRIWMCGGTLELLPCSRVGHIFRSVNPNLDSRVGNVVSRNTQRLVEVWLDEYKEVYYDQTNTAPGQMDAYGDISERVELREELGCKSFRWYMENIYPEKFSPIDSLKKGKLMSNIRPHVTPLCLWLERTSSKSIQNVVTRPCQILVHNLYLSNQSELRDTSWCLDYMDVDNKLQFVKCHGNQGSQKWTEEKGGTIRHATSHKCLTMSSNGTVEMKKCKSKPEQIWSWNAR